MQDLRDRIYTNCVCSLEKLLCRLCAFVPVSRRYIWLESEIDFAENSRAVYEYMISHEKYRNYHIVWCVEDPELYEPQENVIFLKKNFASVPFHFYRNRCKYFVFTHPYWMKKWKKNQVVINAGHGNPFKAPTMDLNHVSDYVLASSEDWGVYRQREFGEDTKVVVLGAPRNDWLYETEKHIWEFTEGRKYSKVIYCMPTFKKTQLWTDSNEANTYCINVVSSEEELLLLNKKLQEKDVLLVCIIHHLQSLEHIRRDCLSNILYLRDEDYGKKGLVMNQMLPSADALLTDFSGVFLDYILLDRPIGFFYGSISQYNRGFVMEKPEDYMPGPHVNTLEDLLNFVDDVAEGRDGYGEFRKKVRDQVHTYQDADNCRRFMEYFRI